jgi:beta-galactosidase
LQEHEAMNVRFGARLSRRTLLHLSVSAAVLIPASRAFSLTPRAPSAPLAPDRRGQVFDDGWRFLLGDGADLAKSAYDDTAWRRIDLPHDWSIEDRPRSDPALNAVLRSVDTAPLWQKVPSREVPRLIGPFDAGLNDNMGYARSASGGPTGFTVGGVGWYRKRFKLPPLAPDARVQIIFDGVHMNAQVWLNGVLLGQRPNGYVPFAYDLTPHLAPSGENVLAVRVANIGRNSRWYAGSGIYRHVWLDITRAFRFEQWGLTVTTPDVSEEQASVEVVARIEGSQGGGTVATRILDDMGRTVAEKTVAASERVATSLEMARPRLWSPEAPHLYQVECTLRAGGEVVDRMTAPLGVRRVEIDAQNGLRINGKPYKLRGGCVHHDNGILGAVAIDRAEYRKVELLKARGFNALRTSHNPPSPAFLDACDRLGVLVMEEAFDMWRVAKNADDYSLYFDGWWQRDLDAMVRRDGNHPSVIMWSFGNEIPERGEPEGVAIAKMLSDELHRLDPTRPVTQAINGSPGPDVTGQDGRPDQAAAQYLDVTGYNYKLSSYERDHARFPDRVMVGTESFPSDVDKVWRLTERSPFLIGDFVWTAMDYLGEAAIGRTLLSGETFGPDEYPWFGASCGDLDLIGQQRPQSLARDVVWGLSPLEVAVQRPMPDGKQERPFLWGWRDELASWTWPGAEGKPLDVSIFTLADRVTIELNGRMMEDRPMTPEKSASIRIPVPYQPGRLVVTAYSSGQKIGRRTLETAGPAAALRLKLDRSQITADRNELAHVVVEVVDADGRLVPDAAHVLRLSLSGSADLAAFGNANPRGVASFRQTVAKSWHGRALAIIRPTSSGTTTISVGSEGLQSAQVRLSVVSKS